MTYIFYWLHYLELNKILTILDKREREAGRKYAKKRRVLSSPSQSSVPPDALSWAIVEDFYEVTDFVMPGFLQCTYFHTSIDVP